MNDKKNASWAIKVLPKKGVYWPYLGSSAYLGNYNYSKQEGFVAGMDQRRVVSSLPVKCENLRSFQVEELSSKDPCRLQVDLRFDSADEARNYIKSILDQQ